MPIFSYLCHAMNSIESRIIEFVQSVGTCTAAELLSYLNQTEEVRKTTLYWYLNKLTSGHRLSRVSRGLYSVSVRKDFIPEVTDDMIAANEILHRELPFSSFCLYKGTEFAPYLHNIATNNVLYVETAGAESLDFEIRNFTVTAPEGEPEPKPTVPPMVIEEAGEVPSLKEIYADRFDFGSAAPQMVFRDLKWLKLMKEQFSILTPENEMKPDSVLDVAGSKKLLEETGDETAVAVRFDAAKALL